MGAFSYLQGDFRGGLWSAEAQGRMVDEKWKTAMNVCLNGFPVETGAWTRRPGFRYVQHTRRGQKALLRPFRFGRDQAYQIEFTDGKMRFHVGLGLLMDERDEPAVIGITNELNAPAIVAISAIPEYWNEGVSIIFNIATQTNPDMPSSYTMFGRQFEAFDLDRGAGTFKIRNPITQETIEGQELNYIPRATSLDTVQRIKEFGTIYDQDDIENKNIRIVQAIDNVVILCDGKEPYLLQQDGEEQFTFGRLMNKDGPYFDVNDTITTLSPDGTTGNIELTASSEVGINNGDGFQDTDVGRLIRFQCGPPVWDSATVYTTNAKVIGPDENIYRAVKTNSNHDPTSDDGTFWEITADTVQWTWLKITAVTDTTHVDADVMGDDLEIKSSSGGIFSSHQDSDTPTKYWRLGVFTDTPDPATGRARWPTCGTYHEGRLCLFGAEPNRCDATRSLTDDFDFAPSYPDGTVADDSGLSFVLNSRDAQYITWGMTNNDGMAIGTLAGEWIIKASTLDDPLTPFDVQARLVTQYGAFNAEPVQAYGGPIFIQARGRKVLANRRHPYGQPEAMNISFYAGALMEPGVNELAWMQEPALCLFATRDDGRLIGCSYKYSMLEEDYYGWHEHEHGAGRIFEALSYGPNFQGTGDCIYVVTALPDDDDPETNPRWVETMMPIATSGSANWIAWHTDASSTAWFIRRMIMANGDSFDGLRVYGLEHAEGLTFHPWIGNLDLGNFVVTDGHLDIPFQTGPTAKFTLAFLEGLSDGTDYGDGEWGMHLRWADAAITTPLAHPIQTVAVIDSDDGAIVSETSSFKFALRIENNRAYRWIGNATDGTDAMRVFDAETGALIAEGTHDDLFGTADVTRGFAASVGQWSIGVSNDYLFGPNHLSPDGYTLVTTDDLTMAVTVDDDVIGPPSLIIPTHFTGIGTLGIIDTDMFIVIEQVGVITANIINSIKVSDLFVSFLGGYTQAVIELSFREDWSMADLGGRHEAEVVVAGCRGTEKFGYSDFFLWGFDSSITSATRANLYRFYTQGPATDGVSNPPDFLFRDWGYAKFATILPTDIDAGWTAFNGLSFAPDLLGGGLVGLAARQSGTGNDFYAFKISIETGEILWKTVLPTLPVSAHFNCDTRLTNGFMGFIAGNGTNTIYGVDLGTGALQTISGQVDGFSGYAGHVGCQIFDGTDSIIFYGQDTTPAIPQFYLGDWATDHAPSWGQEWNRVWIGTDFTQDDDHREMDADLLFVPVNFGISFTSRGQILPPDFGQDAGARLGPAFGKIRRTHWWVAKFVDSFNVSVGTDFDKLLPVKFQNDDKVLTVAPDRFTGLITTTLGDNYSKLSALAWEVTRQYPVTITAIGGYLVSSDK